MPTTLRTAAADLRVLSPSLRHQCVLPKTADSVAKNLSPGKDRGLVAAENASETALCFLLASSGLCSRRDPSPFSQNPSKERSYLI